MADYYVNDAVRKMYGIPLSQLTPEQRRILREDGKRRAKLIEERQKDVMQNNRKAFDDAEKMNRVLSSIYESCQKSILADVAATQAKVKKAGGEWSYANQSALTRSRGLFEQINNELVKLGKKENEYFRKNLTNIYTDQFLRATYTLGQTQTVKGNFNMLNPRLIEAALDYPWSGAMFSDRLWLDKDRLGRNLRIGLTQSMILGEDMDRIADRIQANIDTSRYNAMRIARTETKRVCYVSQVEAWKAQGVSEVRYMAANGGDSRSCNLCKSDNGKKYKLGEEPTLPRHPNCRCWYNPVTPDTFGDNELNELTGSIRGAENYDKWKQEYEVALNPDGSYKPGWKRESWKDGGRVMYTAADGKKYTLQEYKEALKDGILSDGTKKPTAKDLIRERVDKDLEDIGARRKAIDLQKDSVNSEYDKLSAEYATGANVRRGFMESEEAGWKDRSDFDTWDREIRQKMDSCRQSLRNLDDKVKALLQEEKDLDLDVRYVGDDMDRFKSVDKFRSIRTSLRSNTSFDFEAYTDELIEMAQRMDDDALIIQSKLAVFTEKNLYNNRGGAAYYPSDRMVRMNMSSNSHEVALKNGLKGSWQTKFHEEGHQIDHILGKSEALGGIVEDAGAFHYLNDFTYPGTEIGKKISEAIEGDIMDFLNDAVKYCNENGDNYKPVNTLGRITRDARLSSSKYISYLTSNGADDVKRCQIGMFTDAIGLFTRDRISRNTFSVGGWGHDSSYNKDRGKAGANSETWATFFSLRTCGSKEDVKVAKKMMPKTWKYLDKVFHQLAVYLNENDLHY